MGNKTRAAQSYLKILPESSLTYQETYDLLIAIGEKQKLGAPLEITVEKRVGEYRTTLFTSAFKSLERFTITARHGVRVENEDGTSAMMVAEMNGHLLFPYDEYTVTYTCGAQVTCLPQELLPKCFDGMLLAE